MYRKALVPVDGSMPAMAALPQVAKLLGDDGEVFILEVIDSVANLKEQPTPAGFGLGASVEVFENVIRRQRDAALSHIAVACTALHRAGVARIQSAILEGTAGPTLVDVAHREHCDVIVMAMHGRTGPNWPALGPVADYVVRHIEGIPVMLVHPAAPAPEFDPFGECEPTAADVAEQRTPTISSS
jgi:nucleotide-binding universal stress UspA family protein